MKTYDYLKTITDEEKLHVGMYGIYVKDAHFLKSDLRGLIDCEDFLSIQGSLDEDEVYIGVEVFINTPDEIDM